MDLELVGKRAIVTGGSRGIGLAVAKALAADGAHAALVPSMEANGWGRIINVMVVHPGVTVTEKTPEILALRAERAGTDVAEVEKRIAVGGRARGPVYY